MAVSANSWFNNAKVGVPQAAGDFNKFESRSEPTKAIGHKIETQPGMIYRYAHFGAYTQAGTLVATDQSESCTGLNLGRVVASASAQNTTDGTAGSRYIEITAAGVTADQYAGGVLGVFAGGSIGRTYAIRGNTATNTPATGNYRIELEEPLDEAVTINTDFIIQGNKYANLESSSAATDFVTSGATTTEQSAGYYGWVQTKGLCNVLIDTSTISAGYKAVLSVITSGAISTGLATSNYAGAKKEVGQVILAASTGYAMVDLALE